MPDVILNVVTGRPGEGSYVFSPLQGCLAIGIKISILLAVSALALEALIVLLHEFLTRLRNQPL